MSVGEAGINLDRIFKLNRGLAVLPLVEVALAAFQILLFADIRVPRATRQQHRQHAHRNHRTVDSRPSTYPHIVKRLIFRCQHYQALSYQCPTAQRYSVVHRWESYRRYYRKPAGAADSGPNLSPSIRSCTRALVICPERLERGIVQELL